MFELAAVRQFLRLNPSSLFHFLLAAANFLPNKSRLPVLKKTVHFLTAQNDPSRFSLEKSASAHHHSGS